LKLKGRELRETCEEGKMSVKRKKKDSKETNPMISLGDDMRRKKEGSKKIRRCKYYFIDIPHL